MGPPHHGATETMSEPPTIDGSLIEYRTPTGAYHVYHDWSSSRPLSATVAETFTAVAGADASPERPLWDSVDVCAIDELFRAGPTEPRTRGHLSFVHEGYEVEVHTSGLVSVRPPDVGPSAGPTDRRRRVDSR